MKESDFTQGVGGRLAEPKSQTYRDSVISIQARANPYVGRLMFASDLAYVLSAMEVGVTPAADGKPLLLALLELVDQPERWQVPGQDDLIVQREAWVAEKVGRAVGSRLHVGRNRGESLRHILPRFFYRDAMYRERRALLRLIEALHTQAGPALGALAPVYHHLQHAGFTTLGEYLMSWALGLLPHFERLEQVADRLNHAPPVMTQRPGVLAVGQAMCRRLRFDSLLPLRQQTHVTEDQLIEPLTAMIQSSLPLARLAEDMRLWSSSEFDFFDLSDSHASGSSLLPQKKNAFGLQVVIGGASVGIGRLVGQMAQSVSLSTELDSVFHLGGIYQHVDDIVRWTHFMAEVMERGRFNLEELRRKAIIGYAGASEALDVLVYEHQLPLRVAHHELGAIVRASVEGKPLPDLKARLAEELGRPVEIDVEAILAIVRGDLIPECSIQHDATRAAWNKVGEAIARLKPGLSGPGPVETVIEEVKAEARRVCAA